MPGKIDGAAKYSQAGKGKEGDDSKRQHHTPHFSEIFGTKSPIFKYAVNPVAADPDIGYPEKHCGENKGKSLIQDIHENKFAGTGYHHSHDL